MKKIATLFLTVISTVILAQIPNPGFETWTGTNPNAAPTSWFDANSSWPGSTRQADTNHTVAGTYSAQLNSIKSGSIYFGGDLTTGSVHNPYFGTGIGTNPDALTGWYQLTSISGDELRVTVRTKVAGGSSTNGTGSSMYNTNVTVWKQFSTCITYTSGTADSAEIIFSITNSSGSQAPTNPGTSALIDDLAWGVCGAGVEDINNKVSLEPAYPNPANEVCNIIFSIPATALVNAELYDINGRKVMNLMNNANLTSGRYKIPVDVRTMPNGIYFYTITADGVPYTQKLVVAK